MEEQMGYLFTVAHVAQLHEIQTARLRRGEPGIGKEVQRFITELTNGKANDRPAEPQSDDRYWEFLRRRQAKVLWDRKWGIGYGDYEHYFTTIPEVPMEIRRFDRDFPELILVDPRKPLREACQSVGLRIIEELDFMPRDAGSASQAGVRTPYWIRCQDGRRYRGKREDEALAAFVKDEAPLSAFEGVSFFAQRPHVVEAHYMYLWASSPILEHGPDMRAGACLGVWDDDAPELDFANGIPSDFLYSHCHGMASKLNY